MRTTVDLPDDLYREAKVQAAVRGVPLRELVEEALRELLGKPREKPLNRVSFPILRSDRPGSLSLYEIRRAQEQDLLDEDILRGGPP